MKRILFAVSSLLLMIWLSWYGKENDPTITLQMCLKEPRRYDNAIIEVGTEATVDSLTKDGFILKQMGKKIKVVGSDKDLKTGEYISLLAVFHNEGWLELKKIHVAKNRRLKILTSLLPVLLVFYFFFRHYRFHCQTFEFRRLI